MSEHEVTADRLAPARPKRGYWIPALIAMTALLIIGLVIGAGDLYHQAPDTLSGGDVSSELALGIQAQTRSDTPPAISCPAHEPVRQGVAFTCRESIGGTKRTIAVVEIDQRGHLRWSVAP